MKLNEPVFHLGKIPVSWGRIIVWIIIIGGLFANFFIWQSALAQTTGKELSNAEKFSAKNGRLLKREFVDVGEVNGAKIQVLYITDMSDNQKISCVRFEQERYGERTRIATIDSDELDGLIKALKIMQEKVFATTPTTYTEVEFKSRGDFEAGCYFSGDEWSVYISIDRYALSGKNIKIYRERFAEFIGLLEQAKAKM